STWSPEVPAAPNLVFTASAALQSASAASQNVAPVLSFYDSSNHVLVTTPGQQATAPQGSWVSSAPVVAIAPAGTAAVSFGLDVPATSAGQSLYVDDASLTATTDHVPNVVGPLHTQGTNIVDGNGNPVTLRGVNLYGFEDSADPAIVNQSDVAVMKAWGANVVRIALGEQLWDPQSCAFDPNYESNVTTVVNWVTEAGMVAELDLHFNNPKDLGALGSCPVAAPQLSADNPGSDTFWTSVAGQFKNNPLVAFNLYNEPEQGLTDSQYLEGGSVNNYPAEGMQELYNDVRNTGATNLVFVTGMNWGGTPPPADAMVSGNNIVYSSHVYTCPNNPPPNCTNSYSATPSNPYDPSSLLEPWQVWQQQHQVPVSIGEFGWPTNSSGTFNANVITFAEAQHWGWTAFCWDGNPGWPWDLVQSKVAQGPAQPSPSGMPVLAALAQAAANGPGAQPGYWMAAADGGIFAFGTAPFYGSMGATHLNQPVVAMAPTPGDVGYREVASDGGIFAFGAAPFYGSMGATHLNAPVLSMANDAATGGYWLVASDGGIFSFNAPFFGSMGGTRLQAPIVGMVATPDGGGYWLVASDGGVFAFGDATYQGSLAGQQLAAPVVGAASTADDRGYYLVMANGAVATFGDAQYRGSMSSASLTRPIVAMATTPDGGGYWLVASDGGVFSFGDALFEGSMGGTRLNSPVVAAAGA
ncbi:MAG TPA: cellulase family glycosylhydrolase, partial [Acidimicrobiales bacterium]|nr:cellulase family glycosylhydrolase [Acidimicrobiales bacterium]